MANCILKARQGSAPIGLFTKTACGLHVVPAPRLPRPDLAHGLKSFPWEIPYFQSPFLTQQDTMWYRPTVHEGAERLYYFNHNEGWVSIATLCNLCSSPKCYTSPALTTLIAQLLARTLAAVEEGITFPPGFLWALLSQTLYTVGQFEFFFKASLFGLQGSLWQYDFTVYPFTFSQWLGPTWRLLHWLWIFYLYDMSLKARIVFPPPCIPKIPGFCEELSWYLQVGNALCGKCHSANYLSSSVPDGRKASRQPLLRNQ